MFEFHLTDSDTLPYDDEAPSSLDQIRERPGDAFALIFKLQMGLMIARKQLETAAKKCDEIVSMQIGYLDLDTKQG